MLTDRIIQSEIKAASKPKNLNDGSGGKGNGSLMLRIRPGRSATTATWMGVWWSNGKQQTKQLGKYPGLTLKDARARFQDEIRDVLHEGKNPKALAAKQDKPTVLRLFEGYVASMKTAGRSTWDQVEHSLIKGGYAAVKSLGADRLASEIEPGDVSNYLAKAYKRGARVSADRTRSYILAAFNWGIESTNDYTSENRQDWGIKVNPASLVKKDTSAAKARERNLSAAEIKDLWTALDGNGFAPGTAALVKILICCGQRVRETLRIEGKEIDLDSGIWNMPADKTKVGKFPHTIPLPDAAIPVFTQLKQKHGDGYLFPARTGKAELLSDQSVNRSLNRWCIDQEKERFQTRDLRRTWKSRAGEAGIDRFTRDLIQQHARSGDTGSRHYDMTDYLPQMRSAMETWSKWLQTALQ